jgi:hypothetical protein
VDASEAKDPHQLLDTFTIQQIIFCFHLKKLLKASKVDPKVLKGVFGSLLLLNGANFNKNSHADFISAPP